MKRGTKNKNASKNKVGWNDWQVFCSMVLFAALWLLYGYTDMKVFFYIGFIPMIYGILRCVAKNMDHKDNNK